MTIIMANGSILKADLTVSEFETLITEASPSPYIPITEESMGDIKLNINTVSYYYA